MSLRTLKHFRTPSDLTINNIPREMCLPKVLAENNLIIVIEYEE